MPRAGRLLRQLQTILPLATEEQQRLAREYQEQTDKLRYARLVKRVGQERADKIWNDKD